MPMDNRFARTSLALAGMALVVAACGGGDSGGSDTAGATAAAGATGAAVTPPATTTLNDAQIAHIAVTTNTVDSTAGELARTKGTAKDVKDFGQMMVTDHGGVNKQAVALATKLGVTPEDNDMSRQLKSGGDQNTSHLQTMAGGAEWDRMYIDHEVTYHQQLLDALDQRLIPGAQNAELKTLLTTVRPSVAAHLERARSIQSSLGAAGGAAGGAAKDTAAKRP